MDPEADLPVNRTEHVTRPVKHYGKLTVRRHGDSWRLTWPSRMFQEFPSREAAEACLRRLEGSRWA